MDLAASDPKFDKLQVHVGLFARKLAWIYGGYNYAGIYRIHTYTYIYIWEPSVKAGHKFMN